MEEKGAKDIEHARGNGEAERSHQRPVEIRRDIEQVTEVTQPLIQQHHLGRVGRRGGSAPQGDRDLRLL